MLWFYDGLSHHPVENDVVVDPSVHPAPLAVPAGGRGSVVSGL
jgi:hypothetical protein